MGTCHFLGVTVLLPRSQQTNLVSGTPLLASHLQREGKCSAYESIGTIGQVVYAFVVVKIREHFLMSLNL